MNATPRSRLSPLLGLAFVLLVAWVFAGGSVLQQWAYAVEKGRIQAGADELAALEQQLADVKAVSKAFNLVSRVAKPGVVHLRVTGGDATEVEGGDEEDAEQIRRFRRGMPPAAGSGIIFDRGGYILTNNHVVENRERITVVLHDEREFDATVVGTDPKTDLAVIRIDAPDVQPLRFGDSDALEIGDWVIAVGSPFGLQQTVTHGIVSAKGRSRIPGVDIDYQDFIQTDAAINPGNSGGPLLNLRGEVVGVNTAIATRGDGFNAGVAFTIPSKLAMRIANELRTSGTVQRGWIGVSYLPVDAGYAELFGLSGKNGILITAVQRRSPADRAGLQVDDVVVEINGKPIDNSEQFRSAIADMRADERVKLRLVRDGQSRVIDLRLAAQPEQTRENFEKNWIQGRSVARLGIEARTHPPESVSNLTEGAASGGVLVVRLSELGLRASELRPLESIIISCNGKPVRTVRELNDLLQAARPAERYALDVLDRTGERRTVIIQPDAERDRDR